MKKVKYIDLFSGMGGFRIGFEQACAELGFESSCVLSSEIKPHALKALNYNFEEDIVKNDITTIKVGEIPDFDILLGGFPCQSFSVAGLGKGFEDTRGTLFFNIASILYEKRPKGFILENVEGLVTHNRNKGDQTGKTLNVILKTLTELGYKVSWKVIDSKNHGSAQSRKRVYITGTLTSEISLDDFPLSEMNFGDIQEHGLETLDTDFTRKLLSHYDSSELYGKRIRDTRGGKGNIHSWDFELKGSVSNEQQELLEILFKERRKKTWCLDWGVYIREGVPLTTAQIATFYPHKDLEQMLEDLVSKGYLIFRHPKNKIAIAGKLKIMEDTSKDRGYDISAGQLSFQFYKILDPLKVTHTIVATDVSHVGVVDSGGLRRLSVKECLRLCGYPETYSFDCFTEKEMSKVYDLIGNTVVVPVVKDISKRVLGGILDEI